MLNIPKLTFKFRNCFEQNFSDTFKTFFFFIQTFFLCVRRIWNDVEKAVNQVDYNTSWAYDDFFLFWETFWGKTFINVASFWASAAKLFTVVIYSVSTQLPS